MDLKRIEALIESIKDAEVSEVSVKQDGSCVVVKKSQANTGLAEPALPFATEPASATSAPNKTEPEAPTGTTITAPMVGIFHMVDGVGELGTLVKRCQAIGQIESMKLMNEVASDEEGRVAEIFVEDGMPVEYGQSLFRLEIG